MKFRNLIHILIGIVWIALLPKAQAVSPAPDGGYAGGNTAEGQNALLSLTSGGFNTAVGLFSLRSNTTNNFNTAIGAGALLLNAADENTATGAGALLSNTFGNNNTAYGAFTLFSNTTGIGNTADGYHALFSNTTGIFNTATGDQALLVNTGDQNTATGAGALFSNTTGYQNTANGALTLYNNMTGFGNTATGFQALLNNTGSGNTANGIEALFHNTNGIGNIAIGFGAGYLLTTGWYNIDIGSPGVASEGNTIRMGDTNQSRAFIAGIRGVTTGNADAIPVLIDSAGQFGTANSSRRFKKEIKPMDKASESILGFKPVTFHYNSDKTSTPQFGLIAEEVAAVNPDLVVRDKNGEIYTVRYDAVNAMLLNEFLKEHRTVQELKSHAANQEATIARLQFQIEALTARLQKVSAQVEMNRTAPRMVKNTD